MDVQKNRSDSVQKAYQWAFNVLGDKKSGVVAMLLAKQILAAVEKHDTRETAYQPIICLLREWTASQRESQRNLGKLLARTMKVDLEVTTA